LKPAVTSLLIPPPGPTLKEEVFAIKDQLCNTRRSTEKEIYDRIHGDVARPAFHVLYDKSTPLDALEKSKRLTPSRQRRLTGLQDYRRSIMTATTVKQMLEVLFDVQGRLASLRILEHTNVTCDLVLRYLYFQRDVLHRDISRDNILIVDSPAIPSDSKDKHKELCFIKHLQDSRSVQVLHRSQHNSS
jgi:hypothetical protein